MKPVLLIWVVFSVAVFAGLASLRGPIRSGTGPWGIESFGWPGGWLLKQKTPTFVFDGAAPTRVEQNVRWYVLDWMSFACAALIAVALPGSVLAAVRFGLKRATAVPTSGSSQ
ncbi:MAG TPA: hypothetical protein PKI20_16355 [Verrucomicrobiota bacterium]|jgi:hypothetical protein|nr:hypothetical protein [Verrucomicrobiota bacterium]